MNKKKSLVMILLLILLDLSVKVVVYNFFYNHSIILIKGVIGFEPYLHKIEDAYLNYYLKLHASNFFQIFLNIICLIFIFVANFYLEKKEINNNLSKTGFIFFYSGTFCSLIDKLFWKGSLDYIIFFKWVVDIKDVYLTISEIIIPIYIFMIIKNSPSLKDKKDHIGE